MGAAGRLVGQLGTGRQDGSSRGASKHSTPCQSCSLNGHQKKGLPWSIPPPASSAACAWCRQPAAPAACPAVPPQAAQRQRRPPLLAGLQAEGPRSHHCSVLPLAWPTARFRRGPPAPPPPPPLSPASQLRLPVPPRGPLSRRRSRNPGPCGRQTVGEQREGQGHLRQHASDVSSDVWAAKVHGMGCSIAKRAHVCSGVHAICLLRTAMRRAVAAAKLECGCPQPKTCSRMVNLVPCQNATLATTNQISTS